MSTPVKLTGFLLALLVVFIGARGVGAVTEPVAESTPVAHGGDHADEGHGDARAEEGSEESLTPAGLQVSEEGYTFRLVSEPRVGRDQSVEFVIEGPDGEPVTAYDVVHEQPLHLIKIRRDASGFEHVHPTLGDDGVWTARLTLTPGSNRLFADFTPTDGPELVLGADLEVDGAYRPVPAAPANQTAQVGGYRVEIEGELVAGESSPVTLNVTRDGVPVTDLEPYLGSYGHLVALREGDLAYLHVHPEESDAGPEIPFLAEVPSTGRYRLFLDFRHDGVVRTAPFTLTAEDGHSHEH